MKKGRVVAIVQARMGSSRLPGKVMAKIAGVPMIELLLRRLAAAGHVDLVVVATSDDPRNDTLAEHVANLGVACFRGSESDVLDRFVQAARQYGADTVVRITGDCPLVDAAVVDRCLGRFFELGVDYLSNTHPPTFPDGLDVEVFSLSALERAAVETSKPYDREHVTPYLSSSGAFRTANFTGDEDLSRLRWTVDEPADLEVVTKIFDHFAPDVNFSWEKVAELQSEHPKIFSINQEIPRNEGAETGTGQKLWRRAKRVIPGGNMLLSKRPEMFLPDRWPAYFSKAKGCRIWDLDNREFIDMGLMGVGTNTLGYGHPEVDEAVMRTVRDGNMSSLNCPEEVYLAEKMLDLHPWAEMARFARTGGEANAIAIRIARAATGKDKVAICGYHGWHDWYLSANLSDDANLDGHLLPGLEPRGVPRNLQGTVIPFNYNDIDGLSDLVSRHDIGAIKMEVSRNFGPENNFLEKVRDLATRRGIALIFDECTSGFRETFGGLHKKFGVEPDMAVFGKALGNGYAITAVIGRRKVMESAQSTFVSSTFWTERIGPSAALKTLEVMERERSWEKITQTGTELRASWQRLADKHEVAIEHWGLPALAGFSFKSSNGLAYKTLVSQELLSKGYLAGTSTYICTEHTEEIVAGYLEALDPVFGLISQCEQGRNVQEFLKTPVCHSGFRRLN